MYIHNHNSLYALFLLKELIVSTRSRTNNLGAIILDLDNHLDLGQTIIQDILFVMYKKKSKINNACTIEHQSISVHIYSLKENSHVVR